MAPHSSTLAWKIPWMKEPGRLQSMGSLRVRHDWTTSLSLFTFMHWRRKWQPTPLFLPGESQGWGGLVGCRLWRCRVGHDWSDLAAAVAAALTFPFYTAYIFFMSITLIEILIISCRKLCLSLKYFFLAYQFSSVQSLSHVQIFATPWIAARQAFLSITNSRSSLKLMSIK